MIRSLTPSTFNIATSATPTMNVIMGNAEMEQRDGGGGEHSPAREVNLGRMRPSAIFNANRDAIHRDINRYEAGMNFSYSETLKPFAAKYIWWKTPDEAMTMPERVIAQVMDIGDHDDVLSLTRLVGNDALRSVLLNAEAGWFNIRSWTYWHYRLGMCALEQVPPMPGRRFS